MTKEMNNIYSLSEKTAAFMEKFHAKAAPTSALAEFCAEEVTPVSIEPILEEVLAVEALQERVAASSYKVSPHFTKLMLNHAGAGNWGVRVHLFTPDHDRPITEPWHEHRWMLGSTVLSGRLGSQNAIAEVIGKDQTADTYLKYHVPDKKITGSIRPAFIGACLLDNEFDFTVPAGTSYGHHVDLAHRLIITEPTVTAVVTAPDQRSYASFIEPRPLQYVERPRPASLTPRELVQAVQQALGLIRAEDHSHTAAASPLPDMLSVA